MFKNPKFQGFIVLAAGALLGYGAASSGLRITWQADAAPLAPQAALNRPADPLPSRSRGRGCTAVPRSCLLGLAPTRPGDRVGRGHVAL